MNEWMNEWMNEAQVLYILEEWNTYYVSLYLVLVTVNTYCKLTDATLTSAQMQSVSVLLCFL